ncbi:MAG TPA: isoprenylcysteine carboxylmethyltransferase family protein, partial [Sphingomicrobium sp.]|nr:isoprenylcysteine carboxylmethyltransferase family protein [Sphingomicrobium sp.]
VYPTSPAQYGAAVIGGLLFGVAVFAKRLSTPSSGGAVSARSRLSILGIAIQSVSFFLAAAAPVRFAPSESGKSLILAAVVLCLGIAGALLFHLSARALGTNWSLVARTRVGHRLVRDGPFARLRHPIYFAMLLLLAALAIGMGHIWGLIAAVPVFLVGTLIRIREEERLLRDQFGDEYARYASETPAFIPGLKL